MLCEEWESYHTGGAEAQENTIINEQYADSYSDDNLYDELASKRDYHGIEDAEKVQNSRSGQENYSPSDIEESYHEKRADGEMSSSGLASFNHNLKHITARHRNQLEGYIRHLSNVPQLVSNVSVWIRKNPIGYTLYCKGLHSLEYLRTEILARYGKDENVQKYFSSQRELFHRNGLCSETDHSALKTENDGRLRMYEDITDRSLEMEGYHDVNTDEENMELIRNSGRETDFTYPNSGNENNRHQYNSSPNTVFEQDLIAFLRKNPTLRRFMKIIYNLANVLDVVILIGLLYVLFQVSKRITSFCEYIYEQNMNPHVGRRRRRRGSNRNSLQSTKWVEIFSRMFDKFKAARAGNYNSYENMYNGNTRIQEETAPTVDNDLYDVRQDTDRARRESLGSRRITRSSICNSKSTNNDDDISESTPRSLRGSNRSEMGNSNNRPRRRSASRGELGSTPSRTRRISRSNSRNDLTSSNGLSTRSQKRRGV